MDEAINEKKGSEEVSEEEVSREEVLGGSRASRDVIGFVEIIIAIMKKTLISATER